MAILFQTSWGDVQLWRDELSAQLPGDEIRVYPDVGNRADIEFAVAWDIPIVEYKTFPSLRAICLLGSGGSHLRPIEELPDVPIVRLVDDDVANDMAAYALHWIIHFHRGMHRYRTQQEAHVWRPQKFAATSEVTIGVLGFGNIGQRVADVAIALGYPVHGWSRTPKTYPNATSFVGTEQLDEFLASTNILVNVLPLTHQTRRLLNEPRLGQLPRGASIINIGRGGTIDDDALLAALDAGHVEGAALDVFRTEPLPAESPLWAHPAISVTPHAAGAALPRSSVAYIAANIARIRRGEEPFPLFDPARGY